MRSVTYCLPALISQGSILSFAGAGPMPSTPFSEWKMTSRSIGTWSAIMVGMPMPRLTYQPSGISAAACCAICWRVKRLEGDVRWRTWRTSPDQKPEGSP